MLYNIHQFLAPFKIPPAIFFIDLSSDHGAYTIIMYSIFNKVVDSDLIYIAIRV